MSKRGCIIITERDRQTHLDCLLLYLREYFSQYDVIVAHQQDDSHWNKGLLYNATYLELGHEYDYMILHDADFIPAKTVDYSYPHCPTLISSECSQFGYGHGYATFFGGVVAMSTEHYREINGFSNSFRGWGGEDDDLVHRIVGKNIPTYICTGNRFENFIHPRLDVQPHTGRDWNNPDYQHNWKLVHQPPDYTDGISSAQYTLLSNNKYLGASYLRIKTDTQHE